MARRSRPADVLGVFVKAPEPGRVKTRLAHEIGDAQAAALYHRLGREVVAACAAPRRYHTTVWFAPVAGEAMVRSWLGNLGVAEFLVQRNGGLALRLAAAFGRHFQAGASRVVVIGSDCPEVDRVLVGQGFAALGRKDLVLGPSEDGGFYLIGLAAPAPGLFRRIAWSTASVFDQTLRNARRLNLSVTILPTLRDIDTVEDAHALGWLAAAPAAG